jgi:hypothetical protein
MDDVHAKPKLVFFQYKYDDQLPDFLVTHAHDHVKCLSEFFEVTVIRGKCDYRQICDTHQPDVALFESGVNLLTCQRPEITNVRACPGVPKLGFFNADAWCETRSGILSDMDHWGIETFFTISTTAAEHAQEIADNLFVWPNFIDPATYHDYSESKIIPIILTGSQGPQYPWRRRIYKLVSEHYPSLSCPHHGYLSRSGSGQMLYGEQYARAINASMVAPVCGTVAREVVRKHFEIPGCNTCMITEKSPGLQAAGYADMKNCVFADEHDVVDKLAYLFEHPAELLAITHAGYKLVHSRHTLKHRSQLLQWFNLYKDLPPNSTIIQPAPFDPLVVIERSSNIASAHTRGDGVHLFLLRQGDEKLWAGKYEEAEALYRTCLTYMRALPEAKLKMALCNLYKGNARIASQWLFELVQYTLAEYKAIDPDPVEWAYYVISLLCRGNLKGASYHAAQFPWLHHPELDRTRWVINKLTDGGSGALVANEKHANQRHTIHQLTDRSTKDWLECLCRILKACHRLELAERVMQCVPEDSRPIRLRGSASGKVSAESAGHRNDLVYNKSYATERKTGLGPFRRRLLHYKMRRKLSATAERVSRYARALRYDVLDYFSGKRRNDRLCRAIRELTWNEDVGTALVIGAAAGGDSIEALLAGCMKSKKQLSVLCVSRSRPHVISQLSANRSFVKWYQLPSSCPDGLSPGLDEKVREIKDVNSAMCFEIVLMNAADIGSEVALNATLNKEIHAARYIVLENISSDYTFRKYAELLGGSEYYLVDHHPGVVGGYAIFRQQHQANGKVNKLSWSASVLAE